MGEAGEEDNKFFDRISFTKVGFRRENICQSQSEKINQDTDDDEIEWFKLTPDGPKANEQFFNLKNLIVAKLSVSKIWEQRVLPFRWPWT